MGLFPYKHNERKRNENIYIKSYVYELVYYRAGPFYTNKITYDNINPSLKKNFTKEIQKDDLQHILPTLEWINSNTDYAIGITDSGDFRFIIKLKNMMTTEELKEQLLSLSNYQPYWIYPVSSEEFKENIEYDFYYNFFIKNIRSYL